MSEWFMAASSEVLCLKRPQDMNLHENDPQVILWLVLTDVCHLFPWGSINLPIFTGEISQWLFDRRETCYKKRDFIIT